MTPSSRWSALRRTEQYRGLWVALDNCRYDHQTRQPSEGDVVDADEDLAELCARMREKGRHSCAIVFCESDVLVDAARRTPVPAPVRAST